VLEQLLGKVAVRINDAHAVAGFDVLDDQVLEESGFARAGLADDIDVLTGIFIVDTKRNRLAAVGVSVADVDGEGAHDSRASFDSRKPSFGPV
jgi:hypothetical protein